MPKKKKNIMDFLDSYALQIMGPLKEGKKPYSELMKKSELVRSNFNNRLGELLELKLIKVDYDEEKRRPFYSLTNKGEEILYFMEGIDKAYEENKN